MSCHRLRTPLPRDLSRDLSPDLSPDLYWIDRLDSPGNSLLASLCHPQPPRPARMRWMRATLALLMGLGLMFGSAPGATPSAQAQSTIITIVVDTFADGPINSDGKCSLREAVAAVNTQSQVDSCPAGNNAAAILNRIHFNINGGGSIATIALTHGPLVTEQAMLIDGTSQGCGNGPCIELRGSATATTGLKLNNSAATVSGLILNGFTGAAIHISGGGTHHIDNNYIGTDSSGTQAQGNGIGILAETSTIHLIGTPEFGNIISGNKQGIVIRAGADRISIVNNRIGTGKNGTEDLGNSQDGIHISGSAQNSIGATASNRGNLIVNNDVGLRISGSESQNNTIYNNIFGTDSAYAANLANLISIRLESGASSNFIGNTQINTGNVIVFGEIGIQLTGLGTKNNIVRRNYIGVARNSANFMGASTGVLIHNRATANDIGGISGGAGNVIGHSTTAIRISGVGSNDNTVIGNRIGVHNNDERIGNNNAIQILEGASQNTIGGTAVAAGNIIGFSGTGVLISGAASRGNRVLGNGIGTDLQDGKTLGNSVDGVRITDGASDNFVGGTESGAGNIIANNGDTGVLVTAQATRNRILGNRIFANAQLGIDLSAENISGDGITNNDVTDPDGAGNRLQNYPILGIAVGLSDLNLTTAAFSFNSTPLTTFRIEFFTNSGADPSGSGEGENFVGSQEVTTDNAGNASIVAGLSGQDGTIGGSVLTATATDPAGNTSEFSRIVEIVDVRTCFFTGILADGELGADWHTGDNWACDQNATLLPNASTRTLMGDNSDLDDTQFALVQPGNNATANDVQINPVSGLTIEGDLRATQVNNNGLLAVPGTATIDLGLTTQPNSILNLGDADGAQGSATVFGAANLGGTIQGVGTLDLSGAKSTLSGVINPGFGTANGMAGVTSVGVTVAGGPSPLVTGRVRLLGATDLVSATLVLDLVSDAQYDQVDVEGAVKLGGRLRLRGADVATVTSNAAALGQSTYTIMTCSQGCSGAFDTVDAPEGYRVTVAVQELEGDAQAVVVNLEREPAQHTLSLPTVLKVLNLE